MAHYTIVMPTYNEAENIKEMIPQLLKIFDEHKIDGRILIVDDSSPDGTADIVEQFEKTDKRVVLFLRTKKEGLGAAYRAGFKKALELGTDFIFEMDADFSHDPEMIPIMVESSKHRDVVIGSRKVKGGKVVNWGIHRKFISNGANMFTHLLLRLKTHDVTSGFRTIDTKALRKLDLDKIGTEGYAFQIELLHTLERSLKCSVTEVPIVFVDRTRGKSKLGMKDIMEFFAYVILLFIKGTKHIVKKE